jgi:hypothetical protein
MLGNLRLLSTRDGLDASMLTRMCRKTVDIEGRQIGQTRLATYGAKIGFPRVGFGLEVRGRCLYGGVTTVRAVVIAARPADQFEQRVIVTRRDVVSSRPWPYIGAGLG